MTRAVILSGQGRYEDTWHDYAATSQCIAEVLGEIGVECDIRGRILPVLADLGVDLLVVNCGNGRVDPAFDGDDEAWAPARAGLAAHLASGRPVLGVHTAVISFRDNPSWPATLGARWVDGRSMHPEIGVTVVQAHSTVHPIAEGLGDIELYDERYTYLEPAAVLDPYLTHVHDGAVHPLAWAREPHGTRVVYDALGHGVESYHSPGRRLLLQREALWCLGRL